MRYTSADVSKLTSLSPIPDKVEKHSSLSGVSLNGFPLRNKAAGVCILLFESVYMSSEIHFLMIDYVTFSSKLDKCRNLIHFADKSLKGETDCYYGIEACNEVLDGGYEVGPTLMHDCLCIRASLLLQVF